MSKSKSKKKSSPIINIILAIVVIASLAIDGLLIVKTLENHNKEEALFSMDYYKKEETYKAYNDVFNYYSGKISKNDAKELGKLVKKHNTVNKKKIYQVKVTLDDMIFLLKDDIDYSKYEECIGESYYTSEIKYDETTNLVNEIRLSKLEVVTSEEETGGCGCSQ